MTENTILNPFNINNKQITEEDIINIFKKVNINIKPNSLKPYQLSFIHKSYTKSNNYELSRSMRDETIILKEKTKDCLDLFDKHNEKLEFLGDRVIDNIVVHYIYQRYYDTDEGFMTKLKTRLVKTATLAKFSKYLNLDKHLIISNYLDNKCSGRDNDNMLENTFEAFIGAVFLDFNNSSALLNNNIKIECGYSLCNLIITNLMEKLIDFEDIVQNDDNYKDILLRNYQSHYQVTPKYVTLTEDGKPHNRTFRMGVYNHTCDKIIGEGEAKSKKAAEQLASLHALKSMKLIN